MQGKVTEEKHVSRFRRQNGCVLNRVSIRNFSISTVSYHATSASELLVRTWVNPYTPHLISGCRDVDDSGYHRVFDRGEVLPILVHRKRRTCLRRFAEEFGMVKHNIRPEDGFSGIEKLLLQERLHPNSREALDIVGMDDNRFTTVKIIR